MYAADEKSRVRLSNKFIESFPEERNSAAVECPLKSYGNGSSFPRRVEEGSVVFLFLFHDSFAHSLLSQQAVRERVLGRQRNHCLKIDIHSLELPVRK